MKRVYFNLTDTLIYILMEICLPWSRWFGLLCRLHNSFYNYLDTPTYTMYFGANRIVKVWQKSFWIIRIPLYFECYIYLSQLHVLRSFFPFIYPIYRNFLGKIFLALHNKVAINCNYSRTEPLLLFLAPFAESRC